MNVIYVYKGKIVKYSGYILIIIKFTIAPNIMKKKNFSVIVQ